MSMRLPLLLLYTLAFTSSIGQQLKKIHVTDETTVTEFVDESKKHYRLPGPPPLVSFMLADRQFTSTTLPDGLKIQFDSVEYSPGIKTVITFTNSSQDTMRLNNIVPLPSSTNSAYITGRGNHPLSRTHLFTRGKQPVNVIVPDNAWELGFSTTKIDSNLSVVALTRRDNTSLVKATRKRFETVILPGGSVKYNFFADLHKGEWQDGLKLIFQDRMLYDLIEFDSTLYHREDLRWVRESYIMHLLMAWDKSYTDSAGMLAKFIDRGKRLYGGDDVIGLWPTWPTLGLDQRNQFDLFRSLPGGTPKLRELADSLRAR